MSWDFSTLFIIINIPYNYNSSVLLGVLSDLSLTISFALFSFLQCETKTVLSCLHFSHIPEVKAKYDANDLAYTSNFLPLHIDLPYYQE